MKLIHALPVVFALTVVAYAQTTAKEAQDLAAYPLTMENVTRQYQVLIDIAHQAANDPNFKREFQDWAKLPLDRQIRLFETNSKTSGIAKARGIAPRDQVMTSMALNAIVIAYPSIEAGAGPNDLNKLEYQASSPQHVKFFRDHQTEIMKLGAQMVEAVLGSKK